MIEIDISVSCHKCGKYLGRLRASDRGKDLLFAPLCGGCLSEARDEGYEEGFADGEVKVAKEGDA